MVDIGIVESHKENIVPNPNGYRLHDLEHALVDYVPAARPASPLRPKSSNSSARIAIPDDLDPLAGYLVSLKRAGMSAPFMGVNIKIIPAIEDCLNRFASWALYKNDMRYINMWLEYTTFSDAPQRVFEYMELQHIGRHSALFYEKWANLCETQGVHHRVIRILDRGIWRQAQPLSLLKYAKACFLERHPMVKDGLRSPKAPRKRGLSEQSPIVRPKKLKVFVESEDEADQESEDEGHREFPYISLENRENKAPVVPLDGQVLPQSSIRTPTSGARIQVFRDNESTGQVGDVPLYQPPAGPFSCACLKTMLLEERRFPNPVRALERTPHKLEIKKATNNDSATGIIGQMNIGLASMLYAQHAGYTEQIPEHFGQGPPTERLD